ncbi:MAG: redoxin domain-containing protein [Clostridia bacterium]|nr:redoxin domain-containing protein [Clostridia bacterium]
MKKNKLLSVILICVLATVVVGSVLYFVFFDDDAESVYDVLKNAPYKEYTITIKTEGNMLLSGIDVYVYFDSNCEKLIDYGKTDKDGKVSFLLAEYDDYAIVFSGIPKGYDISDYYSFEGEDTNITFSSQLIEGEDIYDANFGVGNVMYDWTITLDDGDTVTTSGILEKKQMLIINFWYENSSSSVEQLKILNDLYSKYEDIVEIIALNPVDDAERITAFKEKNSILFPMASCSRRISARFGVSRCPATIIIDRYGVISLLEVGAVSSIEQLETVFDHFTDDQYVQQLYRNGISEFVSELLPEPTVFEVVAKDGENVKIAGVEIKLTTEDSTFTAITDEAGVARFEVTTKENDILSVINYPDGYDYKGKDKIILSDAMYTYNIIFEAIDDNK